MDEFTEEDYNRYQNDKLSKDESADLQQQAEEDQHFEWWIEESEED